MTPETLAEKVTEAMRAVFEAENLDTALIPTQTTVERPRNAEHGDYASNLSLQLAKRAGTNPRELATKVAQVLVNFEGIAKVDVAGPGFLNITLDTAAAGAVAAKVLAEGVNFGHNASQSGEKINLEFVSANPTGPLHIGSVRWAAVGDALARVLRACGAETTSEYYFNDAGAQIDKFARSLLASAKGEAPPEDGYGGAYIGDIANQVVAKRPDALTAEDAQEVFRTVGIDLMFADIKHSLHEFGVDFDVFFNEKDLHTTGGVQKALDRLREAGHVYEHEGAVWLRTSDFGDDKDRVLRKSDGDWTYFAADCAYYLNKRDRGFERVVIMLGADHHGYIGRMKAMVSCFGDDPNRHLEILIGQLVNVMREGRPVRMSKRAGTVVVLEDVVDAIGVDATRYALARFSMDTAIDLDLDLWSRNSNDNPVHYVQYAHARICSVIGNAGDFGATVDGEFDPALLAHDRETDLLKQLAQFPAVVASAGELREPHRVARYAEDLAAAYHRFYGECRVLPQGDEEFSATGRARLHLMAATRTVLANALGLLGVSAPERKLCAFTKPERCMVTSRRCAPDGCRCQRMSINCTPFCGPRTWVATAMAS
nr:arginine--tRNA ligase [Natronoglycomyces albus]